jgi:hypothetical protein
MLLLLSLPLAPCELQESAPLGRPSPASAALVKSCQVLSVSRLPSPKVHTTGVLLFLFRLIDYNPLGLTVACMSVVPYVRCAGCIACQYTQCHRLVVCRQCCLQAVLCAWRLYQPLRHCSTLLCSTLLYISLH